MTARRSAEGGPGPDCLAVPAPDRLVRFAEGFGTRFVVTVDVEEEFDWSKPLDRFGHGLSHVPWLGKFQTFCENLGVAPVYLVDYPVSCDPLGPAVVAGRAEAGVQLHPWVSPPHEEAITEHNSYAGNLPAALERAKFETLRATIAARFGATPRVYRAGRYGIGPNTAGILIDGGIAIDSSVRAGFDYRAQGGPDFRAHPVHPWWVDDARQLIELPLTTVWCGVLGARGRALYHALARAPRLRGVCARAGLVERVPLTPEGTDIAAAHRAIDAALAARLPVLVFSFHSPSLAPGHTPYVRDEPALDRLYAWWRAVFAHCAKRGVTPTTMAEIAGAARR